MQKEERAYAALRRRAGAPQWRAQAPTSTPRGPHRAYSLYCSAKASAMAFTVVILVLSEATAYSL